MSARSQLATNGSSPIAACSAACRAPGVESGSMSMSANASGVTVYITALVLSVDEGISSSTKSRISPVVSLRR
ncbi:Uncharacterised protein [Mycobacteroides abscessus subsp. abscessus]|nr:Uncharacterised protein [Mycobacteroides abscessus subsp. abscessus]